MGLLTVQTALGCLRKVSCNLRCSCARRVAPVHVLLLCMAPHSLALLSKARAPLGVLILQAVLEGRDNADVARRTAAADVYSYGMVLYQLFTG